MPPLAWVAAVRPGEVRVDHGISVRSFDEGFFEGTWAGPPESSALAGATTVFGSGMVECDGRLLAIPASHPLECLYFARRNGALIVSNSLTGLLAATGLELDRGVDYSAVFLGAVQTLWLLDEWHGGNLRLRHQSFQIPTTTVPITGWYVENLAIARDLSITASRKVREAPFDSFADYKARLITATASLISNGAPYRPVVALSGGYDSTAVAAVASAAGARDSVGFATARPSRRSTNDTDSGAGAAAALGLEHVAVERLAYRERTDLPEADLLSSGAAGEDLVFLGLEPHLQRTIFLNGYWAGTEFAMRTRNSWRHVAPITTAGADFSEFRLRADFLYVPLPVFGAIRRIDATSLLDRAEMDPFRVGGRYDRPIPRRLAEEAGVRRGTFAVVKRAANVLPGRDGLDVFAPATQASIAAFAAGEGGSARWRARRPFTRLERGLVRGASTFHMARLARPLERRRAGLTHFEPRLGNMLLRWAVSVVSKRYAAVERVVSSASAP